MTPREIILELIETWETTKDEYTPSYYIYDGMSSIYENYLDLCNRNHLISMFELYIDEVKINLPEQDFNDINPGPLFYLDSKNKNQVWLFLEVQYVEAHKNIYSGLEII